MGGQLQLPFCIQADAVDATEAIVGAGGVSAYDIRTCPGQVVAVGDVGVGVVELRRVEEVVGLGRNSALTRSVMWKPLKSPMSTLLQRRALLAGQVSLQTVVVAGAFRIVFSDGSAGWIEPRIRVWAPDSRSIYFHASLAAMQPIYRVSLPDGKLEQIATLASFTEGMTADYFFCGPSSDGMPIVRSRTSTGDLYYIDLAKH